MIDVNVAAAPRPGSLYGVSQRMLELLVSNRLRSDLDTATSYTRFISVLKQVDGSCRPTRRSGKSRNGIR